MKEEPAFAKAFREVVGRQDWEFPCRIRIILTDEAAYYGTFESTELFQEEFLQGAGWFDTYDFQRKSATYEEWVAFWELAFEYTVEVYSGNQRKNNFAFFESSDWGEIVKVDNKEIRRSMDELRDHLIKEDASN